MLAGFPKTVTKTKVRSGKYELVREDGERLVVTRWPNRWFVEGRCVPHGKCRTLGIIEYDFAHGFTGFDQLRARRPQDFPDYPRQEAKS